MITIRILMLAFIAIAIGGCSAKPINFVQSYNAINIKLSKENKERYRLIDQEGKPIDTSYPDKDILSFSTKNSLNTSKQCFTVINDKGEVLGKLSNLKLLIRQNYLDLFTRSNQLYHEIDRLNKRVIKNNRDYSNSSVALRGNAAFKNGGCVLPPKRFLPTRPITTCQSERECKEEGGAICYSMVYSASACSIAANELNVTGILTSPLCGVFAAKLAKEKYGMNDVVTDVILGFMEDKARSEWNSGNYFTALFLGASVVGGKRAQAKACTTKFINKHYKPLGDWLYLKARINAEPSEIRERCRSLTAKAKQSNIDKNSNQKKLIHARSQQDEIQKKLSILANKNYQISYCE